MINLSKRNHIHNKPKDINYREANLKIVGLNNKIKEINENCGPTEKFKRLSSIYTMIMLDDNLLYRNYLLEKTNIKHYLQIAREEKGERCFAFGREFKDLKEFREYRARISKCK